MRKRTLSDLHCSVCGFDFEQVYGEIGRDFIEAHHTKPVASFEENEKVNAGIYCRYVRTAIECCIVASRS